MSVFKYNLFRFYEIHDDQMLINILKKSTLALHKDATKILLYQFLDKLKTVCLYPYIARQIHREFELGALTSHFLVRGVDTANPPSVRCRQIVIWQKV